MTPPGPSRRQTCPISQFQRMISGKYKLRILWDLRDGPLRYGQIRKGLLRGLPGSPDISPRVLSRELKSLGEMGMVNRKDFRVMPPRVAYSRVLPAAEKQCGGQPRESAPAARIKNKLNGHRC